MPAVERDSSARVRTEHNERSSCTRAVPFPGVTDTAVEAARQLVASSSNVVVLTGAGVSTASGIPDFRGPDGVWTKNPAAERLSNIDTFVSSAEVREEAWRQLLLRRGVTVEPNAAHRALVAFERTGKLKALITQNIDGLHVAAGSDVNLVIEVHGNSRTTRCLRCGHETPTDEVSSVWRPVSATLTARRPSTAWPATAF